MSTQNTNENSLNTALEIQPSKAIQQYVRNYASLILLQARMIAINSKSASINVEHIDAAIDEIKVNRRNRPKKELALIIGSSMFGAFVQGFITEIWNGNTTLIVIYVLCGFIGMIIVFMGLKS